MVARTEKKVVITETHRTMSSATLPRRFAHTLSLPSLKHTNKLSERGRERATQRRKKERGGGGAHALQMRGHEGAGCVYSGPAEGVCCRSPCRLLCGIRRQEVCPHGLLVWPCRVPARAQLAPRILPPFACPLALVPLPFLLYPFPTPRY